MASIRCACGALVPLPAGNVEAACRCGRTVRRPDAEPARATEAGRADLEASLLQALGSAVPPRAMSPLYQVGLVAIAAALLVLPLLYVGLIAAVVWGAGWHATHNLDLLQRLGSGRGSARGALLAYFTPLLIAAVLVVFMLKPLFARRPREEPPRELDPGEEPFLFEFVKRLSAALGAPAPREIRVDLEVNASAAFRGGFLGPIGGGLVLTIGLPLVAGLTAAELTGVIAHEFGHFSQRAGMRVTGLIRRIVEWFARVAWERDAWDAALERASAAGFWVIVLPALAARAAVWLTRQVLRGLAFVAHALACFMLRQMEFDADRAGVAITGSAAFASTARKLPLLGLAREAALDGVRAGWQERRLPEDFAALVGHEAAGFPADVRALVEEKVMESRTGWFDTHPCDRERVEAAARTGDAGRLRCDRPAAVLFRDARALGAEVSRAFYRSALGPELHDDHIRPMEEFLKRATEEAEAGKALERFFQGGVTALRPLPIPAGPWEAPADAGAAAAELRAARERLCAEGAGWREANAKFEQADERVLEAARAEALLGIRWPAFPKELGKAREEWRALQEGGRRGEREELQLAPVLEPFEGAAAARLALALRLLAVPEVARRVEAAEPLARDAAELAAAARLLGGLWPLLVDLRNRNQGVDTLIGFNRGAGGVAEVEAALRERIEDLRVRLAALRERIGDSAYPFDHVDGPITLREYALPRVPARGEEPRLIELGGRALEQLFALQFRLLSRLAVIAEQVERAVGLAPLAAPERPPKS